MRYSLVRNEPSDKSRYSLTVGEKGREPCSKHPSQSATCKRLTWLNDWLSFSCSQVQCLFGGSLCLLVGEFTITVASTLPGGHGESLSSPGCRTAQHTPSRSVLEAYRSSPSLPLLTIAGHGHTSQTSQEQMLFESLGIKRSSQNSPTETAKEWCAAMPRISISTTLCLFSLNSLSILDLNEIRKETDRIQANSTVQRRASSPIKVVNLFRCRDSRSTNDLFCRIGNSCRPYPCRRLWIHLYLFLFLCSWCRLCCLPSLKLWSNLY